MKQQLVQDFDYFLAWCVFFIANLIIGFTVGFLGSFIITLFLMPQNLGMEAVQAIGGLVGFILGLPVSYLCFRMSVNKFLIDKIKDSYHIQRR